MCSISKVLKIERNNYTINCRYLLGSDLIFNVGAISLLPPPCSRAHGLTVCSLEVSKFKIFVT